MGFNSGFKWLMASFELKCQRLKSFGLQPRFVGCVWNRVESFSYDCFTLKTKTPRSFETSENSQRQGITSQKTWSSVMSLNPKLSLWSTHRQSEASQIRVHTALFRIPWVRRHHVPPKRRQPPPNLWIVTTQPKIDILTVVINSNFQNHLLVHQWNKTHMWPIYMSLCH